MRENFLRRLSYTFAALIAIVVILLASVILILMYISFRKKESENDEFFNYKLTRYNPLTHTYVDGFVSSKDYLGQHNFKYYFEEDRNSHVVISTFDLDEFKCTGTCHCENSKRRSTGVISKSLIYLVAAISSVSALNLAKDHFHEQCVAHFSEKQTCEKDNIESKVDECSEVDLEKQRREEAMLERYPELEKYIKAEDPSLEEEIKQRPGEYFCQGSCKPVDIPMALQKEYAEGQLDERYWTLARTNFDVLQREADEEECSEIELAKQLNMNYPVPETVRHNEALIQGVETTFILKHLKPFCEVQSMRTIELEDRYQQIRTSHPVNIQFSFCEPDFGTEEDEGSVLCVKLTDWNADTVREVEKGWIPPIEE